MMTTETKIYRPQAPELLEIKPVLERVYDPEQENDNRAKWAQAAIDAFTAACPADDPHVLADLLCNLMHLCDRRTRTQGGRGPVRKNPPEGWDFNAALRMAVMHYQAETDKTGGW